MILNTKNFDPNFTNKYHESDQYVALQNRNISELWGWSKDNDFSNETLEILVKITNKETKQTIYRQAVGYTAEGFTKEHIMLSYRSLKKLGLSENKEVSSAERTCSAETISLNSRHFLYMIYCSQDVKCFPSRSNGDKYQLLR